MRRFNYDDNDDYREDVDNFFNDEDGLVPDGLSEEEYKAIVEEEMAAQRMQIKIVYRDLNHRLLRTSIRACEKTFLWWFYSHDTKLKMIEKTYKQIKKLEEEEE